MLKLVDFMSGGNHQNQLVNSLANQPTNFKTEDQGKLSVITLENQGILFTTAHRNHHRILEDHGWVQDNSTFNMDLAVPGKMKPMKKNSNR